MKRDDGQPFTIEKGQGRLIKPTTDPDKRHVVWLEPNAPEAAYAAMMKLLGESNAAQDEQQQEVARTLEYGSTRATRL